MTPERLAAILHDMRCAVTQNRCSEWGCANEGATIGSVEWRCHVCRAYETLREFSDALAASERDRIALQQRVAELERYIEGLKKELK